MIQTATLKIGCMITSATASAAMSAALAVVLERLALQTRDASITVQPIDVSVWLMQAVHNSLQHKTLVKEKLT